MFTLVPQQSPPSKLHSALLVVSWQIPSPIFAKMLQSLLPQPISVSFNQRVSKDQLISKAIYGLLTSPKKWTDEFVLFAFLLFMANKTNSTVHFLGESIARQSAFRFYLTFKQSTPNMLWGCTNFFLCGNAFR